VVTAHGIKARNRFQLRKRKRGEPERITLIMDKEKHNTDIPASNMAILNLPLSFNFCTIGLGCVWVLTQEIFYYSNKAGKYYVTS
jgi:hypothetical protein